MVDLPIVSFVIPVRNDASRLRRCLTSIAADDYPADRREVIVVDNGSADDSLKVAHEAGATVLELPDLTVAELRNRGAETARGDILAFVDADHELRCGWTVAAAETLSGDLAAAAGDFCHAPEDGTWVQRAYDALRDHPGDTRQVTWLGGGNLAVLRAPFRAIGGFDTTLVACEDVDLCNRLRAAGHRLVLDPRMFSVHHGDPATLADLFRGELWRGRDNLKVTFRRPLSWREVPSIAIPVIELSCLAAFVAGIAGIAFSSRGALVAAAALAVLCSCASLRTVRMVGNGRPRPWWRAGQFFAVAIVYDVARALALVSRRRHHRR
jgi:GT2 family glycosyltransferase